MNYKTDKILVRQEVERKREVFIVEDSVIIPDVKPDILSIIETSSNLYVYKKELNNGKIKIDGGIQLNTIYTADNESNSTRALQNTLDFSKLIDIKVKEMENSTFSERLNIKNIDSKIVNGRKISIKVSIECEITLFSNRDIEYISQIDDEDVQKIGDTIEISLLKNRGETLCNAKETISIEDNFAEILSYSISVRNKEQKVSYNKILSKAECVVDILYINEDNQIKNTSAAIPITGFIDMPGVSDDNLSVINYETKNISVRPDGVNKDNILVDIEFFVNCDLYENRTIDIIKDLYSPEEEIALQEENIEFIQNRSITQTMCEINNKINTSDAIDNKIYIVNLSKENITYKIVGNTINFEGSINIDFLFESNVTKRLELRSQSFDFSHSVKLENLDNRGNIDTDFEISNIDYKLGQSGEQEFNIEINLIANNYSMIRANLISDVKFEKTKSNKRKSSLIIYFVKEGDTLWSIAKKFRTTIEEIVEVNGIENTDKLEIGEQLFIPRHVSKLTC